MSTDRSRGALARIVRWMGELGARVRRALSGSAWTPLLGRASAYGAGFLVLALVGSGHASGFLALAGTPASAIGGLGAASLSGASADGALAAMSPSHPPRTPAPPPGSAAPASADAHGHAHDAPGGVGEAGPDGGAKSDPASEPAIPAVTADGKVVLNLATEDDLRRLPGVGPTRARSILALRSRLGRFRKIEELLRVKGIGRRSLARLRPLLLVDPPAA